MSTEKTTDTKPRQSRPFLKTLHARMEPEDCLPLAPARRRAQAQVHPTGQGASVPASEGLRVEAVDPLSKEESKLLQGEKPPGGETHIRKSSRARGMVVTTPTIGKPFRGDVNRPPSPEPQHSTNGAPSLTHGPSITHHVHLHFSIPHPPPPHIPPVALPELFPSTPQLAFPFFTNPLSLSSLAGGGPQDACNAQQERAQTTSPKNRK
jgi:hypothetical protein